MSGEERNVVYGMVSGLALLMDVHRPEQSNGHGAVYINGSGWRAPLAYDAAPLKDIPGGMPYIEAMTAGGYTVFAINHRQAPRFKYPAAVEDAQRAVRFVRYHSQRFGIQATKIGASGGSSGGHLVSLLGTLGGEGNPDDPDPVNRESSRVQAVVARAAPVDLALQISDSELRGWAETDWLGMLLLDSLTEDSIERRTFNEASPIRHVSTDSAPFLLIHGDADTTVPPLQSLRMKDALNAAGVPVELIQIPGGAHGPHFPGAVNPPDYLGAMVSWLDRYLCGA